MPAKREITRADIMPMEEFAVVRKQRRSEISAIKRIRRLAIGPDATIYFESYDTMWWQIHEMPISRRAARRRLPTNWRPSTR